MKRICVDCRECPGGDHCGMVLCAENEKDLLDATVNHYVTLHRMEDTPELREGISRLFKVKVIENPGESFNEALSHLTTIRIPF